MDAVKSWYQSRTVWASIVTVVAGVAGALGMPIDSGQQGMIVEVALHAVTALSGIIALFGRFAATARIL